MTTALTKSDHQNTLRSLFERQKTEIARAIPKHLTADILIRIALTTIFKTPKLMQCDPRSLIAAMMDASQLGLKLDNTLGQAYLVPYGKVATLIVGYKGLIDLAYRSGKVSEFYSYPVYENDEYSVELGLDRKLYHKPASGDRGALVATYAVIRMKDGGFDFEWMWKDDIDKVMKKAKARKDGPWVTHYDEMARKTPIRKLAKRAPVSSDFQTAVIMDEKSDVGPIHLFKDTSEMTQDAPEKVIDVEATQTMDQADPGHDTENVNIQKENWWNDIEHWKFRQLPEFYLAVMVGFGVPYKDHEISVDGNVWAMRDESKNVYTQFSIKNPDSIATLKDASPETISRVRRKFEVNTKIDSATWDRLVKEAM